MRKLTRADIWSLEEYAGQRAEFRRKVMQHKKNRRLHLGPNATLYFEDRLTMHYQIQEMLRAERIFEPEGIQEELDSYNPLIPDGSNWKLTFMMEYEDADYRRQQLRKLVGIEDRVWVQVDGHDRIWPIADEDLERADEDKTSSVHFLRFELEAEMIDSLKRGGRLAVGIDHGNYRHQIEEVPVPLLGLVALGAVVRPLRLVDVPDELRFLPREQLELAVDHVREPPTAPHVIAR
jgi:hypothetical protein